MSRKKSSFNVGCLVAIIIIVILYVGFIFWALPAESLSQLGLIIQCILGLLISYIVWKLLFGRILGKVRESEDNSKKSLFYHIFIGIACILITGWIVYLITSFDPYGSGIVWIIGISIIVGYFLYKNSKE